VPVESSRETGSRAGSIAATIGVVLLVLALAGAVGAAYWLNNERTQLQHQMIQQSLQVLELREKLTRTEVALQERTAALATRDAALAEANRPVIPVRVTFRLAFMGQGLVASIRNVADRPLNVIADLPYFLQGLPCRVFEPPILRHEKLGGTRLRVDPAPH